MKTHQIVTLQTNADTALKTKIQQANKHILQKAV
jgi:hypothetical protein